MIACSIGAQTLSARLPGKSTLAPGAAVGLLWRPEHQHFFDAATGARRDIAGTFGGDVNDFIRTELASGERLCVSAK